MSLHIAASQHNFANKTNKSEIYRHEKQRFAHFVPFMYDVLFQSQGSAARTSAARVLVERHGQPVPATDVAG